MRDKREDLTQTMDALAAAIDEGAFERAESLTRQWLEVIQKRDWKPEEFAEVRTQARSLLERAEQRSEQLLDLIRVAGQGRKGQRAYMQGEEAALGDVG